jgi:hypothetical protein
MRVHDFENAFKKIAVTDGLAFFEQEIGSLTNETTLILDEPILKGSEVALSDSFNERFELIKLVLV